jgi:hypothetical protein
MLLVFYQIAPVAASLPWMTLLGNHGKKHETFI